MPGEDLIRRSPDGTEQGGIPTNAVTLAGMVLILVLVDVSLEAGTHPG
ncbi:MAG: hypothetical protein ABFC71_07945 [Methanoregula sp.]